MLINWTNLHPDGLATNGFWTSLAVNSDCSVILAADASVGVVGGSSCGRLYLSTDTGGTWSEVQPKGDTDGYWYCAAMDADGSSIIVGEARQYGAGCRLYISTDTGGTWAETQPSGNSDYSWSHVASDNDGSVFMAFAPGERVHITTDGGVNWADPIGVVLGGCDFALSLDGSKIILSMLPSIGGAGKLYTSTDTGGTWVERKPLGYSYGGWKVASDSDGSNYIIGDRSSLVSKGVYTSVDGGINWSDKTPTMTWPNNLYTSVSSNNDGSILCVMTSYGTGGEVTISDDGGGTWNNQGNLSFTSNYDRVYAGKSNAKFVVASTTPYPPTAPNYGGLFLGITSLVFSPTSGPIGVTVTVSGSNYTNGDVIGVGDVLVNGEIATHTLTVDVDGNLSGDLIIPGTSTGLVDIVITASLTGTQTYTDAFTINPPSVSFSPDYGMVGSILTVTGSNWAIGETIVDVTINSVSATNTLVVDGFGNITGTITCPSIPNGSYSIIIEGTIVLFVTSGDVFSVGIIQNSFNNVMTLVDTVTGLPYTVTIASGLVVATPA
jgi:photosystem II stability/assembly factor-like uncharacterized protein